MVNAKSVENWLLDTINEHKNQNTPLIEILHVVQEREGYISYENAKYISNELNIAISQVFSVATFYSDFKLSKRGKHLIRFCMGTACSVMKNSENVNYVKERLGISLGQTTKDNLFSIEPVNCFGTCSLAPVVEVDGKIHSHVKPDKLKILIDLIIENEKK
jgi:NADH:ubiquinone oxidoreductase subunit E